MTDWIVATDPSTSYSGQSDSSAGFFADGQPIGLLLSLTYSIDNQNTNVWQDQAGPATTWTTLNSVTTNWT